MTTLENPYAGQGPVLLDIGGDVGALIVTMSAESEGTEVESDPQVPPRTGSPRPFLRHATTTTTTTTTPRHAATIGTTGDAIGLSRLPTSRWWAARHQVGPCTTHWSTRPSRPVTTSSARFLAMTSC